MSPSHCLLPSACISFDLSPRASLMSARACGVRSVSGGRAASFGALVRAWVESAQTHERDFKIEARSIRVALDALHDFVLAEDSNKAAVQGYERRRAAHYGRQEAESSLSPGVVGINFCSAHSKFLFLRTRETFPTIWFLFSSTDSMRGHRGRADGKLQSFNLVYLATE